MQRTLQPGGSLSVQRGNINGQNRTILGSIATSNLQCLEVLNPLLSSVNTIRHLQLSMAAKVHLPGLHLSYLKIHNVDGF